MTHLQVTIFVKPAEQETAMGMLMPFSPEGFEQREDCLIAYFAEEGFDAAAVADRLGDLRHETVLVGEQNWNAVWESNFSPVVIGTFCGIRAHFHRPIGEVAHEIIITPKMSFGTGHHATTSMMVMAMEKVDFGEKTVLDFGTGTGILAILAEKLGAQRVVAIDVDTWSIENTRENIEQNGVRKIEVEHTTTLPAGPFDIILANINKNVILEYLPQLRAALNPGGLLLLSGILVGDEQEVEQSCLLHELTRAERLSKLDWSMLLYRNKG